MGIARYRNEEVMKLLGERVRQLRLERGMSQQDLANRCNTDLSQINRIELGKINTSVSHLFLIAHILKISVSDLIDFKVDIDPESLF